MIIPMLQVSVPPVSNRSPHIKFLHTLPFCKPDLGDEYRQQTQQLLDSSSSAGKLRRNLLRSAVSLELGPKYAGGEVISREDLFQDGPGSAKRPNDSTLSADVDSALSDLDNDESSDSNYKETVSSTSAAIFSDAVNNVINELVVGWLKR